MIRTGEEHRFGCARPRGLMSVGGAANCFYESVTPLDQYGASIPCRRLWRRSPQGQALLRLVRRGASEPSATGEMVIFSVEMSAILPLNLRRDLRNFNQFSTS